MSVFSVEAFSVFFIGGNMSDFKVSKFVTVAEDCFEKTIMADTEDMAINDAKNQLNGGGFKFVGIYQLIKILEFDYKIKGA